MKKRFLMLFMMLLLSALVVTAAGYAWFTASAISEVHGTNVKAETQGVLKVWTPNNGVGGVGTPIPNQYANYVTYIDFSDPADAFYNSAYANHVMNDQSGNGSVFFKTESNGNKVKLVGVSSKGVALVYDLYFSAYTGVSGPEDLRDIYLTGESKINITTGEQLNNSIRVAFLHNNTICGIYQNSASNVFNIASDLVLPTNTAGGWAQGITPETGGKILPQTGSSTFASTFAEPGLTSYLPGQALDATTVRKITAGTTLFQTDAKSFAPANNKLTVVIWFEGSDPATTDAVLGQDVNIDLVFAARVPAATANITYYLDGGVNSTTNPAQSTSFPQTIAVATKAGYTFDGWYDNAAFTGTAITSITSADISAAGKWADGNVTLYAKWTENVSYLTISYDVNGAGSMVTSNLPSTFLFGAINAIGAPASFVNAGYTFGSWNTASGGEGTTVVNTSQLPNSNTTIYAIWNAE